MLWPVVHISAEPVCMAYFAVPRSNPVPPGPLPISPPLSFNLTSAKMVMASAKVGMADSQKQPRLKCVFDSDKQKLL